MAEVVNFGGRQYIEPVSRARTVGGVGNAGANASFGNILIIDDGIGAGWLDLVSSHTTGTKKELNDYLFEVNSTPELQTLARGGVLYDLAQWLYNPSNTRQGARKIYVISARTATPASVTITTADAGVLTIATKRTGTWNNGVLDGTGDRLIKGYNIKLRAGTINASKYVIEIHAGTWKGEDAAGNQYGGITKANAVSNKRLVIQSPEISNIRDFKLWAEADETFTALFSITTATWTGGATPSTGIFAAGDVTTYGVGDTLFSGATETYNAGDLTDVLNDIVGLDWNICLGMKHGTTDGAGVNNLAILGHIVNNAEFKKFLVVGAGNTAAQFSGSLTVASTINSRYGIAVHGGFYEPYILNTSNEILYPALYKAAMVAGLLAGLEPQESATYKDLRIRKEAHVMTQAQREQALQGGLLHTRFVPGLGNVVNQAVNTLQQNTRLINVDGSSHTIEIERISAQLNRELQEGAIVAIGKNLVSFSEADMVDFTVSTLQRRVGTLIVSFANVKVQRQGSTYFVEYDYQANSSINKVFHTGTIVDPTV